jgi:excisionase family DNA binding protein
VTDDREAAGMSMDDVARMLGVSRRTVARMVASGELPSTKIRARRVVDRADALARLRAYEAPVADASEVEP